MPMQRFGTTASVAVALHPLASVPVTEYTVVVDGVVNTIGSVEDERSDAGDHTYVEAPLAIRLILFPEQIAFEVGEIDTWGFGATVIVACE